MSPIDYTGSSTAAVPQRVFLSHTSDLGKPDESGSFVAAAVAAVLRARHAVTDMAYFAARAGAGDLPGAGRAGSSARRARTSRPRAGPPGVHADGRPARPRASAGRLAHAAGAEPAVRGARRGVAPGRTGAPRRRHDRGA